MVTVVKVFESYRDFTRRWKETRTDGNYLIERHMGPKTWHNSPMQVFRNFTPFNGKFMAEIPLEHRLPDVNPHLIDVLQQVWSHRCSPERRLMFLDMLEQNLGSPRPRRLGNLLEDRLIIFSGDPRNGTSA